MILRIGGNSKGGNMKKEEALKIYNALSEKIQKEEEESFSSTLLSIVKNEPFDLAASRRDDVKMISLRSRRIAFAIEHFKHPSDDVKSNLKIDFDKLLRYLSSFEGRMERICSGTVSNLVDCVLAVADGRLNEKKVVCYLPEECRNVKLIRNETDEQLKYTLISVAGFFFEQDNNAVAVHVLNYLYKCNKKRNSPRSEEYKEIANVLYSIMNAAPANEE